MKHRVPAADLSETKRHLLDAGVKLMRTQGFHATSVDDICSAAGVTKGGFFHYFKSKDELAKAAVEHFAEGKAQEYRDAAFRKLADPLDRVYGRLEYVAGTVGNEEHKTRGCLIGMFAQELSFTRPELRSACQELFLRMARDFEKDLTDAKALYAPEAEFEPKRLAMLYVSIVQGSLMLAKASENTTVLADNIDLFRRHLESLFGRARVQSGTTSSKRLPTARS